MNNQKLELQATKTDPLKELERLGETKTQVGITVKIFHKKAYQVVKTRLEETRDIETLGSDQAKLLEQAKTGKIIQEVIRDQMRKTIGAESFKLKGVTLAKKGGTPEEAQRFEAIKTMALSVLGELLDEIEKRKKE